MYAPYVLAHNGYNRIIRFHGQCLEMQGLKLCDRESEVAACGQSEHGVYDGGGGDGSGKVVASEEAEDVLEKGGRIRTLVRSDAEKGNISTDHDSCGVNSADGSGLLSSYVVRLDYCAGGERVMNVTKADSSICFLRAFEG